MPLNEELIKAIDNARANGAIPREVVGILKKAGVSDPEDALAEYSATPLPDGRPRGRVNPGDPLEHGIE